MYRGYMGRFVENISGCSPAQSDCYLQEHLAFLFMVVLKNKIEADKSLFCCRVFSYVIILQLLEMHVEA